MPIEEMAAWRTGRLRLKEQSVAEVIKQFERYYSRGFKVESSLFEKQIDLDMPTRNFPLAIERINYILETQVDTSQRMIKFD